jgi:Fur family ferric uptake transcriptional regulator
MEQFSKFAPRGDIKKKAYQIFEQFLTSKSLRMTDQRKLILDCFLESEWHLTLEELYQRIREINPKIGYSTVYRTLKLLCECDLARELPLGGNRARFEPKYNVHHHDHLICQSCGKVIEFYVEEIEKIQQQICEEHQFTAINHIHEIYGFCKNCKDRKSFS